MQYSQRLWTGFAASTLPVDWDECTMSHKGALEAVDRMLRDLRQADRFKGSITLLLSGDFCQTLPVFGRPYYRSSLWYSMSSVVCNVLYCGKTVRPSQKGSEGVNRKPGSKSSFFGSPPYFYFRFRRYGHRDGLFCLIFAHTAQKSVIDGPNGLSSSKPCAYIVALCGQN